MPLLIDTHELARSAEPLEGRLALSALPRLASLLSRETGELAWRARGERRRRADGSTDELLHLALEGEVSMECVRCLGETVVALRAERDFRLVGSEEQAAREDVDDLEYDVLAGGRHFDLGGLIEDEAIRALPPIARHEQCELPAEAAADGSGQDSEASGENGSGGWISPFSELAALKKPRH
jgi:uncharacterized protein